MNEKPNLFRSGNRRSFLKSGLTAAGATMGIGLLVHGKEALAQSSSSLTAGDAAILQFLAAGEALEVDFWTQYNELGGIPDNEVPGGGGNRSYTHCLKRIDRNFPQYIHDNTDDEISHQNFINAYLASKGAPTADLEPFRTLPGSTATGSSGKLRLTNLMQLTLDTGLVDTLPQQHQQSRRQSHDLRASSSGSAHGAVHSHSEDRRRPVPRGTHSGDCQHRGVSYADRRTRRRQPAPGAGSKKESRASKCYKS